jgi:hypothetical protein
MLESSRCSRCRRWETLGWLRTLCNVKLPRMPLEMCVIVERLELLSGERDFYGFRLDMLVRRFDIVE